MKWNKRQKELLRLRARHAGLRYRIPLPNLREGLDDRKVAPCGNNFDAIAGYARAEPYQPPPPGLVVDCLHKSSLQVILPSEIPWIGKKP